MLGSRDPEERLVTLEDLDQQESRCVMFYFSSETSKSGKKNPRFNYFVFPQGATGPDGAPGARGPSVSSSVGINGYFQKATVKELFQSSFHLFRV